MIESEFKSAINSGAIKAEVDSQSAQGEPEGGAGLPVQQSFDLTQFLPMLIQLQSTQAVLTAPPTYIPRTFQEQIQFVFTGGVYYLYLYFNNQWNKVTLGATGVTQILAGSGISVSPVGGTGAVTVTNAIAFKTGSSTRIMNASSGTQTIAHGLGKVPSIVRISGAWGGGSAVLAWSSGNYNGTTMNVASISYYAGASASNNGGTFDVVYLNSNGAGQAATITMDATNIYLAWSVLGGGGSGTANLIWEVEG
jgi:hypothetical protein